MWLNKETALSSGSACTASTLERSYMNDKPGVDTGLVGALECGDVMKLQIKVILQTGVLAHAKFKPFRCTIPIGPLSLDIKWLFFFFIDAAPPNIYPVTLHDPFPT